MRTAARSKLSMVSSPGRTSASACHCDRLSSRRRSLRMRRRRFSPVSIGVIGGILAILGGCSLMPSTPQRAPAAAPPSADPSLGQMSSYLDMMERLSRATPAEQAEIAQNAKDAAELTPTTSNRLRYALALATPGHGKTDEEAARQMLTQ